ncbi:histidine phosphatase family protein [Phytoactinopolyspora halotolerans]|uniref:Histidine phosphatase family protein n=1 Tax=Phytoactinopolyspora halotolerans TaxID=1981512 RepID=A0A6L9S6G4_9ACTN|nr:histidine phosphatase family protein [Phytoactinopolyspora halotolerans]NEE00746.1 histidine phosphatase family protein [Phytoactinopolyspora halotolerans]
MTTESTTAPTTRIDPGPAPVPTPAQVPTPTSVTLARHGRTPWHDGNRYTGSSDIDIDHVGRAQAEQLANWAREAAPDVLYSSTMQRTRQTAAPMVEALGLPLHTDERLRELDFGEMEGRTLTELRAEDPQAVELFEQDAATHHLPGGEHPEAAADRATAALADIVSRHQGQDILVVCHNTIIRLIACRYLGIPLGAYRTALRGIAPVATTRFSFRPDGSVMLDYYNRPTDG